MQDERCEICKWYHKLKYNFERDNGFLESHCCDVLLHTGEKGGWVQETEPYDMCEMFEQEIADGKADV